MGIVDEVQAGEFSFRRHIKSVAWRPTLIHNLLRSVAAGLVFGTIVAIANSNPGAFIGMVITLPIIYFYFLLPVGLIAKFFNFTGSPLAKMVLGIATLPISVGDPLVWVLSRVKPEAVPCPNPKMALLH